MLTMQNQRKTFLLYQRLIALLVISLFFSENTLAQNNILRKPISISLKKVTVNEALLQISKKINYYFTFDQKTFDENKIISITVKNETLKTCLDRILNNPELYYTVIDNHIIINKKDLIALTEVLANDTSIKIIKLQGIIIDEENGQGLAYATVGVQNYDIGTITNAQGVFILKVPKRLINENICVSYIGYLNTCIPIEKLYGENVNIVLQRSYISVQEVIIRSTDPKMIIRAANKNIVTNYSTKPVYLTTFYRESVKQKDKLMFFSEAVLKLYKSSYANSNERDQVQVLRSRNFRDLSNTDTVRLKLKSGLDASSSLDFVNNKIDFLDEESFQFYNYKMVDIITYNDHPAYVIEFEQKKSVQEALYTGRIYVDIDKLAYIGAEFSINPLKISKVHSRFVVKKERRLRLRVKQVNYRVSYHDINGKYYLRHVKGELQMKVKKKRKLFATTFTASFEMAVSGIDTLNVHRFKRKETDKQNTIFVDDIREYDNAFWEDYNFIKPDDNWQEAVKKLQQKLALETSLN